MRKHLLNFITNRAGCYKRGVGITLLALFMLPLISSAQLIPAGTCAENVNNQVTVVAAGACTWPTANVTATALTGPPSVCSTAGVFTAGWLWFIATGSTTIVADSSTRDVVIWVYSGTCGSLTEIGCADFYLTNGPSESVTVQTVVGNHYYIRIGRKFAAVAAFNTFACVSSPPPPVNDDCGGAIVLTPATACNYVSATNYAATPSISAPAPSCDTYMGNDVWYRFTVPAGANGGPMTIDTRGDTLPFPNPNLTNGAMAVYTGTCPGLLTEVACDDSSSTNPGNMPAVTIPIVTTGTVYYVRVWASGLNSYGAFKICVSYPPPVTCNPWDNPCSAAVATIPVNTSNTCIPSATQFNLTCATPTPGVATPSCAPFAYFGNDIWFRFVVPVAGQVIIAGLGSPSGQGTLPDGMMALYTATGSCPGSLVLTQIPGMCDDDSGPGFDPLINATGLTPGTTIYIRYWGYAGSTGTFRICAYTNCTTAPSNDECTAAIALTASPLGSPCNTIPYTNACASSSAQPNPGCAFYNGGDVWFSYNNVSSTSLTFTGNAGSFADGALAVYSGTCPGGLVLLGCDDDSGPGLSPQLTVTVPIGTIYIRYWQYAGGIGGTFGLCVQDPCPGGTPANDLVCNATFLPLGVYVSGTNSCSGHSLVTEPPAPGACAGWGTLNTVWYRFIAPASGCVKIRTNTGTLSNTMIAVFSGACGPGMTSLGCNDDVQPCGAGTFIYQYSQLTVNGLIGGTTYYIMVDGYQGQTGTFNIIAIDGGVGCANTFQPLTGQDCALPLRVCNVITSVANPGFQGVGNVCDYGTPSPCTGGTAGCGPCATSCMCSGERGSGWFAIHIASGPAGPAGFLEFSIEPNDYTGTPYTETDYDWVLFGPFANENISNCTAASLLSPIRCTWSALGVSGVYGAANYTAPPQYGAGYSSGFRQRLAVNFNEVYYINISNYAVSSVGFRLIIETSGSGGPGLTAPIDGNVAPGGTLFWSGAVSTNWHDPNNWGGCTIPDCRYNVIIPSYPANQPIISTQNASARSVNINTGASLTLNTGFQLMVCNDYQNDGTFTANAGSFTLFQDTCTICPAIPPFGAGIAHDQSLYGNMVGANKFWHTTVTKPSLRKVITNQDLDVAGNFLVSGSLGTGTFNVNGKYQKVAGNFTVETAPSVARYITDTIGSTLEFNGTAQNYFNRDTLTNVVMNQGGGGTVTLQDNGQGLPHAWMKIRSTGTLTLTSGVVIAGFGSHTNTNRIDMANRAAAAVSPGNANSYVQGILRRYMPQGVPATGSYDFPVGSAAKGYERINFNFTSGNFQATEGYWDMYFDEATNPASPVFAQECASDYHNVTVPLFALNHGIWTVVANPSTTTSVAFMTVTNYNRSYTNPAIGSGWTVQYNKTATNTAPNWLLNPFPMSPCVGAPITATFRQNVAVATVFPNSSTNPAWFATAQSQTALPVELLSFEAKSLKSSIKLDWATASEKNNKGFEIQRSVTPPDNFEKMGWIDGHGSTTTSQYYNFEDKTVKEGITYYYRLQQFDYNGNYEFSKIVAGSIGGKDFSINVIPNPYSGSTNISFNLKNDSWVKVEVISVIGQKVATLMDGMQETGLYQFDFSAKSYGYASGIYLVRIAVNGQIYTQRLVEKDE